MQSSAEPQRARGQRGLRTALKALVFTAFLAAAAIGCQSGTSAPTVVLQGQSGPVAVEVELALTPESQARGLMWRQEMGANQGMLFIFPKAEPRAFWMKNTPLPLDIIYIGEDRRIVHIARDTQPYSENSIPSRGPSRYVLEVNAGFTAQHGVDAGAEVQFLRLTGGP